jgi:uncharacterized protein
MGSNSLIVVSPDLAALTLLLPALVASGLFAGLIGGLFGVGGGTVLVPVLFAVLELIDPGAPANLHVAVGTSLATIIATSLRSLAAHRASGAVDEAVLRAWLPWVGFGAVIGAGAAAVSAKGVLGLVYGGLAAGMGLYFVLGHAGWRLMDDLPKGAGRAVCGGLLGAASAMMGIGGGAFGSTLMTLAGRQMHQAVATASGFGVAIAVPATLGFVLAGWGEPRLPAFSLGHVSLPGVVLLSLLTAFSAPWGARLAHRLDRTLLRRLLGGWLLASAAVVVLNALA